MYNQPDLKELVPSDCQETSVCLLLQHERLVNRRARKMLLWNIILTCIVGGTSFLFVCASVWFSYSAKSRVDDSRDLFQANKDAIIDRLEGTSASIRDLQDDLLEVEATQKLDDRIANENADKIRGMEMRILNAEVDLKVVTAMLKSFKSGEVKLEAGVDTSGTRRINQSPSARN